MPAEETAVHLPTPGFSQRDPRTDRFCVAMLFLATLFVYSPALLTGRVLLPADIVLLMRPWSAMARERFPEFRFAQNQMHGPIFEYYAWRHYARERLSGGEVPLWNPYELGGNVLLANSQSAVFYPPNVLLYLFSLPTGINLVTALHTFLTGLFLFGLLRTVGLRAIAAITGALVWMFCGLQMVWTEFQTPTAVLCWLPGILWAWERYVQGAGWKWGVFGAGCATTMILLAGHLHFAFYVVVAFVMYALWRTQGRGIPILLGALLFGLSLSLVTMLPVLEIGRMNFRAANISYAGSIALRAPPEQIFTLLIPNLLGNPRDYITFDANGQPAPGHSYRGKFDFIEYTMYLGVPALILALCGLFLVRLFGPVLARSAKSAHKYFILLGSVGLLLAFGTPLCALFFYGVPGYRQFNATGRALCLFCFAMAALAAYGMEALTIAQETEPNHRVGRVVAAVVCILTLAGLVIFPGLGITPSWQWLFTDHWFPYQWANLRHFVSFVGLTGFVLWWVLRGRLPLSGEKKAEASLMQKFSPIRRGGLWLLPLLAVADLVVWGWGFNPITDRNMLGYPTQTTDFLRRAGVDRVVSLKTPESGIKSFIVPNYNAVCHLREVQGADSLHTWRYHHFMARVVLAIDPSRKTAFEDPNTLHVPAVTHRLFDMLNVRYITTMPDRTPDTDRFMRVADAELTIWENPHAFGKAWVVGKYTLIRGLEEAFAHLNSPHFDPRQTALLEHVPPPLDPRAAQGRAEMTHFTPHRITVEVDTPAPGLLVLSEVAYPGWRAHVDGQAAPLFTANYILRAVPVPAGRHRVQLTYDPASYRVGLYGSALALAVMVASLTYRGWRHQPK